MSSLAIAFVAIAALVGNAKAYFRINCGRLMESRIDPIVSPGKVSSHLHTLVGASNLGYNSTYQDLMNSQCTTCEVQADKSAYWTPQLFYEFPNKTFTMVPHSGSVVYYIGRGTLKNGSQIFTPFPPGFQMLSGDSGARSYDPNTLTTPGTVDHVGRPISDRVSWACLSDQPSAETPNITNTNCNGGLRAQIHFQSCWNGKDLYKSDNSHVAYLSQIDNGICPDGYQNLFPHLFMETSYSVNSIQQQPGGQFVLSTGDPTGYSMHADFFNAWDPNVLKQALATCTANDNSTGSVDECPALMASDVDNAAYMCPPKPPVVNETIYGLLPALPGCITITPGPARADASDMNCPSSVIPPNIIQTAQSTPIASRIPVPNQPFGRTNWKYVGCAADNQGTRTLAGPWYTDTSNLTVENCQTYCQTNGQKYAGMEIGTQCFCDNYIPTTVTWNQTQCNYACSGDSTVNCGGAAKVMIYDNTAAQAPPRPSVVPKTGTYVYKGCYKELPSGRALANASTATNTMTVDACAKFCLGKNWRYFGVEYGRECYCGKNLNSQSTVAPATDCNMPCAGNTNRTAQMCGAGSRLGLYYSKDVISPSKRWLARRDWGLVG